MTLFWHYFDTILTQFICANSAICTDYVICAGKLCHWHNFDTIMTQFLEMTLFWHNLDTIMTQSWHNFDTIVTQFVNVICTDYVICTNYDTLQSFSSPPGSPRSWCHMRHSHAFVLFPPSACSPNTLVCVWTSSKEEQNKVIRDDVALHAHVRLHFTSYSSYVGEDELIFRALCVRYDTYCAFRSAGVAYLALLYKCCCFTLNTKNETNSFKN